MARFQVGDLALTVRAEVPENNGHVVRILSALDPIAVRPTVSGYEVERLDGQPFARVQVWPSGRSIAGRPRDVRVHAAEKNLQPLLRREFLEQFFSESFTLAPVVRQS